MFCLMRRSESESSHLALSRSMRGRPEWLPAAASEAASSGLWLKGASASDTYQGREMHSTNRGHARYSFYGGEWSWKKVK